MATNSGYASSLKAFLASIASIKGDLSNITAPPFLLSTESTTQYPKYWAEKPSVFVAPALEEKPEVRALLVLKWFLSTLMRQQHGGRRPEDGVKKPLNSILGELYLADWKDPRVPGSTRLVSEQVSHHPPVTACRLWNEECGISAEGYTRQEVTFSGSVNVKQTGHAILRLARFDESYLIPLPDVKVKGTVTASPYPELSGTYYITSSSGFTSEIDFTGKKLLSGTKNGFEARLYPTNNQNKILYTVKGTWTSSFTIRDEKSGADIETFDVTAVAPLPPELLPLREQDPWESMLVWHEVATALQNNDMGGAASAKNRLEEAQRAMRKAGDQDGKPWTHLFFRNRDSHPAFEVLAKGLDVALQPERTGGVWVFNEEAYRAAKRPFHGDSTPYGMSGGLCSTASASSQEER